MREKMSERKIIDVENQINETKKGILGLSQEISLEDELENEMCDHLEELVLRVSNLARAMNVEVPLSSGEKKEKVADELDINAEIDSILNLNDETELPKVRKFPTLTPTDMFVCCFSGMVSVLIDVIFVGTPDVVKLYRGGEQFDGSKLTGALRKIGSDKNGKAYEILKWFSEKCTVPYDIPIYKDTLKPNNHRLRSFGHDPLFGLVFAVVDIVMGTTTCIDNSGKIRILPNKNKASSTEKYLSVIYYFGHLISDVCTARGLPIPGFFMLEFFQNEIEGKSISEIAEDMYINGYDLRHMASMSVPVFVKNMIIDIYLKLTTDKCNGFAPVYEKEKAEIDYKLKKHKMKFIADTIGTAGNVVKFIAPPSCGNPTAINIVQIVELIEESIIMIKAGTRATTTEEIIANRKIINKRWNELFDDIP